MEEKFGEDKLAEWSNQIIAEKQQDVNNFIDAGMEATVQCARKLGLGR